MKKSGFTVWELIGVLAILVILAMIVAPVFSKVRETTGPRTCYNNEKILANGILQYILDNDERMPNIADAKNKNVTWRTLTNNYLKAKDRYQCPQRGDKPLTPDHKLDTPDGFPQSYAANYTGDYSGSKMDKGNGAFGGPGSDGIRVTDIERPDSLIMLCEVFHHSTPDFNIDNLGAFNPHTDMLWAGHTDESNYLFADGHVKYLKPLDTKDFWHRDASIPLSPGAVKVLQNAHLGKENSN